MAEKVAFELVSPEKLLLSKEVDLVVVPGAEGNFGVLPRHAPMISTVRPGVIEVYETRGQASDRIFIAGGFAEVTPDRCTVLAEEALSVGDIDVAETEQRIRDLTEDVADAKTETERTSAAKALEAAKAKREAAARA
ncbi:MAG: F0F1 ATP synthase subunit epsilon [Azospirillaceae bacterium]